MEKESKADWAVKTLAGTYSDPLVVAEKMKLAAEHCHLVGGLSSVPLIEGYDVMITVVPIDLAHTYPTNPSAKKVAHGHQLAKDDDEPKWGIGKPTLMLLAGAALLQWLGATRTDDGKDPRYAHIHVDGRYRGIDNMWRPVPGDRDCDLRDGSDQIKNKSPDEVDALRANMLRSTETKAKLRAIREAFGVPSSMTREELEKPFVFARQVFTGRSSNPANRDMFAVGIAIEHLGGVIAAFGPDQAANIVSALCSAQQNRPAQQLPEAAPTTLLAAPPAAAPPPALPPPAIKSAPARTEPRKPRAAGQNGPAVVSFGKKKGTPLTELEDSQLTWYIDAAKKSIADPEKAKWIDRNKVDLDNLLAEVARREHVAEALKKQPPTAAPAAKTDGSKTAPASQTAAPKAATPASPPPDDEPPFGGPDDDEPRQPGYDDD